MGTFGVVHCRDDHNAQQKLAEEGQQGVAQGLRLAKKGLPRRTRKERNSKPLRRRVRLADEMDAHTDFSSEATESNEEAIAAGMMNLGIVCNHVHQEDTSKAIVSGNLASQSLELGLGFTVLPCIPKTALKL